jgi:hypothetical protein
VDVFSKLHSKPYYNLQRRVIADNLQLLGENLNVAFPFTTDVYIKSILYSGIARSSLQRGVFG